MLQEPMQNAMQNLSISTLIGRGNHLWPEEDRGGQRRGQTLIYLQSLIFKRIFEKKRKSIPSWIYVMKSLCAK